MTKQFKSTVEPTQSLASPWVIYRTLIGVGSICALLIVSVYIVTAPSIQQNRDNAMKRAVLQVLPGAVTNKAYGFGLSKKLYPLDEKESTQDSQLLLKIYAGYDGNNRLVGVAVPAQGRGYQDVIRILYGYDPQEQNIIGMQVLESRETPGLGDKIETDVRFVANFKKLAVSLDNNNETLLHLFELVKAGQKIQPWQIDGITGATISSQAITDMLNSSGSDVIPLLYKNRQIFSSQPEGNKHE